MKEQLIDTAEQLFLKYGLRSVSIDDICNELHISKKTFYQYFRQKEQLVKSMLDRICEKHDSAPPMYNNDDNMVDVIVEHGARFASKQSAADRHIAFMYDLKKYYPDLHRGFVERMNERNGKQIAILLRKGVEQGMVREDINIPLTSFFITRMMPTMLNGKIDGATIADKARFGIDTFLRMVCSEEGMKRYLQKKAEKNTL